MCSFVATRQTVVRRFQVFSLLSALGFASVVVQFSTPAHAKETARDEEIFAVRVNVRALLTQDLLARAHGECNRLPAT